MIWDILSTRIRRAETTPVDGAADPSARAETADAGGVVVAQAIRGEITPGWVPFGTYQDEPWEYSPAVAPGEPIGFSAEELHWRTPRM